jgi:hypothetical protein
MKRIDLGFSNTSPFHKHDDGLLKVVFMLNEYESTEESTKKNTLPPIHIR